MSDETRPGTTPALTKRIRRRVTARQWDFFAATSPGLENICRNECTGHSFFEQAPEIRNGGLEFQGPVHLSYLANLHLRTANRILMRVGEFKATNFRRLEKKIAEFPWELFVKSGGEFDVRVSSKGSRLYHSGAVEERVAEILRDKGFSSVSGDAGTVSSQAIHIRIVDDLATVSLDSSGDNLYIRGLKTHGGRAPLRETTASAILATIGYTGDEPLLDPMCGSGTFSLEAAMISRNMPPGWNREFAFFQWPCFSQGKWNHMKSRARERFRAADTPMVFASDMDGRACRDLADSVESAGFETTVRVGCVDFFDLVPSTIIKGRGSVVLNPPYGFRMESENADANRFYSEIFRKLKTDYIGWKAAVVVPQRKPAIRPPFELKSMRLFHGGLDLLLYYGRIPR